MKRSIKIRRRNAAPKKPLVLVVDDYADVRERYSEYLSYSGYRVAEAKNGAEALAKAFEILPDVILMDDSLPAMDGWETTRRLKADRRTRGIPVVALTASNSASYIDRALHAGCDGWLTKPCRPEQLVGELERILSTPKELKLKN
jgi:CheY-like chemotaxis protein